MISLDSDSFMNIEELRRKLLFEEANATYAALQQQPEQWRQIEQEDAVWDATLGDGLEPESWPEYELEPQK